MNANQQIQTAVAQNRTPGQGRALNPMASVARHPRLAVLLFLMIAFLGLPAAILAGKPKYEVTASLQVAPRYMKNLSDDEELLFQSNTQFRQFIQQQVNSITRYDILERALNKEVGTTGQTLMSTFKLPAETPRKAIERLQRSLIVFPVPDTYLIQIKLFSQDPLLIDQVVNAVANEYVSTSRSEQLYGADNRVEKLQEREQNLQQDLEKKLSAKTQVSLELGLATVNTADGNPYNKLIEQVRLQLIDARLQAFSAKSKLDAFNSNGETDIVIRSIEDAVLNDPGLNSFKSSMNNRQSKLLSDVSGMQADHPAFKAARLEIADLGAEMRKQEAAVRANVRGALVKRYQVTFEQADTLRAKLESELKDLEGVASNYSFKFNQAVNLAEEIDFLRKELDKVKDRLGFFSAEEESFGLVRLVTPAKPAEIPMGTSKKKILLLALVAALLAAVVVPTALDLIDTGIYAVGDLEKALGIPAMGWVIEQMDPDSMLFGKDQLRRLATSLIRESDSRSARIMALAGTKIGSGSTRLTLDLARTLAEIGKSVLVIEANAYRPSKKYSPGKAGCLTQTLAECLESDALPVIASSSSKPGVLTMAVGTKAMARNLPNIERLGLVLNTYANQFDFVLVDAPPILLSADSELIARAARHVVVVVEAENTVKKEVIQVRRVLEKINPDSVGSILNRVSPENGFGGLNAQLTEFVTGQRQQGISLVEQARGAGKAVAWELAAIYTWVRYEFLGYFDLPEKYYKNDGVS